jgi:histidine ammonia-lyase
MATRTLDAPARPLTLRGEGLSARDVAAVAAGRPVALDAAALCAVEGAYRALAGLIAGGEPIYGVTTGYGALVGFRVGAEQSRAMQLALLRSHAAGLGEDLPRDAVRAALTVRINGLLRGHSGVRPVVLEHLAALLNEDVVPCVPRTGSLGASGDLAPSAHASLVLVGEGEATDAAGRRLDGPAALAAAGLEPLVLEPKEGLALINGTHFMAGLGALATVAAERLVDAADAIAALSIEALHGATPAFDADVHALRPLPGQVRTAECLRAMLAGSRATRGPGDGPLQDAYSLRCVPQVHGAAREGIGFCGRLVAVDLDAVTDNPVLVGDPPRVVSAGNFHGQSLALGLDTLRLALADLAAFSERRTFRLLSPSLNEGLPPFLTRDPGASSGLMIVQYTAAALVSELRALAHPVSVDSIPTSDNQEDHVSMGMTGALMAREAVERVRDVLAVELLCAAQAAGLGDTDALAPRTAALRALVREHAPARGGVRSPAPDLRAVAALIGSDELAALLP